MAVLHLRRPAVLWLLAAAVPLALCWWLACRRAGRAARALTGKGGKGNLLRGALRLCAMAALVIGLAGPALPGGRALREVSVPVVFVLDVSASMEAADVPPDRLGRARDAIREICDLLPAARPALVAAAGDAAVVCPPTTDRDVFLNLLRQGRTDWFSDRGSRAGPALRQAAELLGAESRGVGAVVLVSDGEFHSPPEPGDIENVAGAGAVLHTLTVGSEQGHTLPAVAGRQAVITHARPDRMRRWGEAGGGRHWRAGPQETSLPQRPEDIVSARLAGSLARVRGQGLSLAPALYALAALLLAADRLLPRG